MRLFGIVFVAAAMLALPAGASARPAGRVLVRTPTHITQMSLDRSGRAAWIQLNAIETCYRIHRGALLRHQNETITGCYPARGPTSIAGEAGPVVASARGPSSPLHIAWGDHIQTYDETLATIWVPNGHNGRARIASIYDDCGPYSCAAAGRVLGPLASKDGVVLYAVDDVVPPASCDPAVKDCVAVVTGGRVRRVRYSPGGGYATTVPGAPAAAALATAGGRLAEQVFTPQGEPAPTIQIRDVASGALVATVAVNGTLDTMAMSHAELALLVTSAAGNHLVRYDAATGTLLASTPLGPTLDKHTLAICGRRILYQTSHGMETYRIDLGRSIAAGIGSHTNPGPALDDNGIRWITYGRWTPAHGGPPSVIHGLALP